MSVSSTDCMDNDLTGLTWLFAEDSSFAQDGGAATAADCPPMQRGGELDAEQMVKDVGEQFAAVERRVGNLYDWKAIVLGLDVEQRPIAEKIALVAYVARRSADRSLQNDYWARKSLERIAFEIKDACYQQLWQAEAADIDMACDLCGLLQQPSLLHDVHNLPMSKQAIISICDEKSVEGSLPEDGVIGAASRHVHAVLDFHEGDEEQLGLPPCGDGAPAEMLDDDYDIISPLYDYHIIDRQPELRFVCALSHLYEGESVTSSIYTIDGTSFKTRFFVKAAGAHMKLNDIGDSRNLAIAFGDTTLEERAAYFTGAATAFAARYLGHQGDSPYTAFHLHSDHFADAADLFSTYYHQMRVDSGYEATLTVIEHGDLADVTTQGHTTPSPGGSSSAAGASGSGAASSNAATTGSALPARVQSLIEEHVREYAKRKGLTKQLVPSAELLGEGYRGAVYAHRSNPQAVIKKCQDTLLNEFAIGYFIDHPSVCKSHDLYIKMWPYGAKLYKLVMEKVAGVKLSQRTASLTPDQAVNYLEQMRALGQYLNDEAVGIAWADLNFENVFSDATDKIKCIDLGEWRFVADSYQRMMITIEALTYFVAQLTLITELPPKQPITDFAFPATLFGPIGISMYQDDCSIVNVAPSERNDMLKTLYTWAPDVYGYYVRPQLVASLKNATPAQHRAYFDSYVDAVVQSFSRFAANGNSGS